MQFFFNAGPNPLKVALLLEELEIDFTPIPIDTYRGQQFESGFIDINPNAKVPALVDGPNRLFDSSAILLYLADRFGRFIAPSGESARAEALSWLLLVATGIGPSSGQCWHFRQRAPENCAYTVNRFRFEVERHYFIVEQRLTQQPYLAGAEYSIADIALWGWARLLPSVLGEGEHAISRYPRLRDLVAEIETRPAALRALALATAHPFKTELDADARRFLFPHDTD